jgi:3-oxoacyl-[acyl-carrier protein] reductase
LTARGHCSRGIGAALTERLPADGADAVVSCRENLRRADEVAAQIRKTGRRAAVVRTDSADPAAVVAAVDGPPGRSAD